MLAVGLPELRRCARTTSQLRFDGVVPLRQGFMALQSQRGELVGSWLEAARIVAAVQVSSDGKAGLSFCSSGIVEDLLVGVERFTSPVS